MSLGGTRPANRREIGSLGRGNAASCQPLGLERHPYGRDRNAIGYRGCPRSRDFSLLSYVLKLPSSSHDGRTAPPFPVRPFLSG